MSRPYCLAAIALVACVAVASATTRPAPGKFVGKTSQGKRITLRLGKSGGLRMEFREIAKCNRGKDREIQASYVNDKPHVKADGNFDYRKTYRNLPPTKGINQSFDDSQHIHGVFGDRTHVTGYVEENLIGSLGLKCKVRLTFNAKRTRR